MAYPDYTSSAGLKTTSPIKAAGTTGVGTRELIIQNHAAEVLYIKFGAGASATVFDIVAKACSVAKDGTSIPIVLINVSNAQEISCFAVTNISYTVSYR